MLICTYPKIHKAPKLITLPSNQGGRTDFYINTSLKVEENKMIYGEYRGIAKDATDVVRQKESERRRERENYILSIDQAW